jgi:hypothetical protein
MGFGAPNNLFRENSREIIAPKQIIAPQLSKKGAIVGGLLWEEPYSIMDWVGRPTL